MPIFVQKETISHLFSCSLKRPEFHCQFMLYLQWLIHYCLNSVNQMNQQKKTLFGDVYGRNPTWRTTCRKFEKNRNDGGSQIRLTHRPQPCAFGTPATIFGKIQPKQFTQSYHARELARFPASLLQQPYTIAIELLPQSLNYLYQLSLIVICLWKIHIFDRKSFLQVVVTRGNFCSSDQLYLSGYQSGISCFHVSTRYIGSVVCIFFIL